MTIEKKIEALENYLSFLNLKKKYFIHTANKGKDTVFSISEKLDSGAIRTHTPFLDYKAMCKFLDGYIFAKNTPL